MILWLEVFLLKFDLVSDVSLFFEDFPAGLLEVLVRWLGQVWDFHLVTVDENRITVGTILVSLVLLVIGIWLSRVTSRRMCRQFISKFGFDRGLEHIFETVLRYIFIAIATLFAMRMANLPLTVFTVLGGALAIGVGFGSQNIVNNFISGIILMIERPISVGDFIELGEITGEISDIGTRSTRIQSFGNKTFIVPNSFFLEKNVVNLTHQMDKFTRLTISVGVSYGSDTRLVEKLLLHACKKQRRVLKQVGRMPEVFFAEFGQSALMFELAYWIQLTTLRDLRILQSDLRFRIIELFRQNQVVIAYPQSDVHLHSNAPIPVVLAK